MKSSILIFAMSVVALSLAGCDSDEVIPISELEGTFSEYNASVMMKMNGDMIPTRVVIGKSKEADSQDALLLTLPDFYVWRIFNIAL